MTELLVILVFIAFCSLALRVSWISANARRASPDSVRAELLVTDNRITDEFHRARHAMNDAAGQSWRNLAG